ncbi:MAG: hypothetical protein ACUVV6_04510 [Thermoplasmatota archaeon]
MFVSWGTRLFLLGAALYFLLSLFSFASALGSAFLLWRMGRAAEAAVSGLVLLLLSGAALYCFLLGREKLVGASRAGDYVALRRRLLPAVLAGLLFGLALGGILLLIGYIRVEELPERIRLPGR